MDIYLIDGTYELFRYFYAVPSAKDTCGQEIGAVRGVLASVLSMIEGGATHVGVATDHVIESFRNDLYLGYKTGEGVDPALLSQFPILEEALQSMGVLVWPMTEFEADDALASAAAKATQNDRVRQVIICTPATLRVDVPVFTSIDDLLWRGPAEDFKRTCEHMKAPELFRRALAKNASQTLP